MSCCNYCGRKMQVTATRKSFCSNACLHNYSIQRFGTIIEPQTVAEENLMDAMIAAGMDEVREVRDAFVNRNSPADDSPQAEIRMRRHLDMMRRGP